MTKVGRLAALLALAVVVIVLGVREVRARAERELATGDTVAADVPLARSALETRLLAIERAAARSAEDALRATRDIADPTELFVALEGLDLSEGSGVHVEDRYGRILAWAGASLRDATYQAIPRDRPGGSIVEASTSRRIAVERSRDGVTDAEATVEGAPARAICHRPIERSYPLRSRALESWSLEEDVAARFRVAGVRVLAPDADAAEGDVLRSAFGGPLARLDVRPLSSGSWVEAVDAATERRRGAVLAVACLILSIVIWFELPGIVARRGLHPAAVAVASGAIFVAARFALTAYPMSAILGEGPLTDPNSYAGSLPFSLGDSPAGFLLTGMAAVAVAAAIRQATLVLRRRRLPVLVCLAVLLAAAIGSRLLLTSLVEDVVANSQVEFFSVERVLPYPASAAVLGGLVTLGSAVVLVLESLYRISTPDALTPRPYRLVLAVVGGLVVAPTGPLSLAGAHAVPLVAGLGFVVALGATAVSPGVATRAAVVPVAVAIGLFVPLERHLTRSLQEDVVLYAAEHSAGAGASARAERQAVEATLDQVGASKELLTAMRRGRLARDLAARLWADSPLSKRSAPSRVELLPAHPEVPPQHFSADAPPSAWLPDPATFPAPTARWTITSAGRGLAQDSEWVVGETPIQDGDQRLGSARVVLGVRRALIARLLELDPPGASARRDTRRLLPPAVSEFDYSGQLLWTDDPYRAAGSQLDDATVHAVIENESERWVRAPMGEQEAMILYAPRYDDAAAVVGANAFVAEGGTSDALTAGTKAALFGAVLALLALGVTAWSWARRARLRLAHRLVISYAIVAALPLLVLAWVNHELVRQRYDARSARELRESVSIVASSLFQAGGTPEWAKALEGAELDGPNTAAADALRDVVYSPGHRSNLFIGHRLRASSDQSLSDTRFQPARMPGPAYREVILRGRPFYVENVVVGGTAFMIGYAPLRDAGGAILGAVSVPLLHQRELREREQAQAATAVLGFYLASLVVAMGVGTWLAARVAAPLRNLRNATKRVAGGDLSERVPSPGAGELGDVVDGFNTMMRDLSESRGRLVKAEKEAAWRDMARQVAHEVKNPLTPMRLAAEHLRRAYRDNVPDFGAVLARAVDVIVRQTAALERIATDFRDFARLPVQRRERVDVGAVLRRALDLYHGVEGLAIEADIVPDLPPVLADPDELQRVLLNICGNAVEAQEGGAGALRGRLAAEGDWLVCTIQDEGPGIAPELLPHLFEPSFSTKTGGTGLGLAICKRAIEDLGGTIHVRSTPGKGATVVLRLPVTAA